MASKDEHKFRYILQPGNDFGFVAQFRMWLILSVVVMVGSIAVLFINKAVRGSHLNWTIDFKGGSEIIYAFKAKHAPSPDGKPVATTYVKPDATKVRQALEQAGAYGFDVSDMSWNEETPTGDVTARGILLRTPRFGALTTAQKDHVTEQFKAKFGDRKIELVRWTGDRVFVRAGAPIHEAEADDLFKAAGIEAKPWGDATQLYTTPDKSTGDYEMAFSMHGLDRQYEQVLEKALPDVDVEAVQSSTVSAKAGAQLRDDGIKSLFYALLLIVLYLAIRFDIRYAPGALLATLHDAIAVVGVFALTWTEVSLTSVAALLTVIGFSVNDTVVIFDRIRENSEKLKDKRLERIIDISLNEVLVRTILTSTTLFACTLMMNVFGTGLVRNFAFAMNIGIVVGCYSSIFLASPVFLWISKRYYSGPAPARARAGSAVASEP